MLSIKKIANVFLAVTLLTATTGFTLNKHYCMGRLKSVAVNVHADHCYEGEKEQMPCCEDVSEEFRLEEVMSSTFDFDSQPELYQLAIISWVLFDLSPTHVASEQPQFQRHSPPPPDTDYQVDHQVFQI